MKGIPQPSRRRIAIISSNGTPWGGSEELWQSAAVAFARDGAQVRVFKPHFPRGGRPIDELRKAGCKLVDLTLPGRLDALVSLFCVPAAALFMRLRLWIGLRLFRPQLVLLSQGANWDGISLARVIHALELPYVVISQKASELNWPTDRVLDRVRRLYASAQHSVFVSQHNRALTEMQLGRSIASASIARNPFLVAYDSMLDWPSSRPHVEFACVARLYPLDKGQDLLLSVLARESWRRKPVSVTFYGEGPHRRALEDLAARLRLDNVRFVGQVDDVGAIWSRHQALILPSRCEGLPLALVEAMLAGRLVIATDAGGTKEVVDDNVTGFLASAATPDALEEAMNRAWSRRHEWPQIATVAAERIRRLVPRDPGAALVTALDDLRLLPEPVAVFDEPQPAALLAAQVRT